MTARRRPGGAPRLIDWTGERCVPWAPDIQVVYEHLHRYMWSAQLVAGKRVLDLASGEGFGAAILSESASSVVGVDIDELSVEHARLNYKAPNLTFEVADARALDQFEDDSFDVVIALEMIEHVSVPQQVLAGIKRILAPGGLLVMSTPDKIAYGEASEANPFHERELTHDEFSELLGTNFAHVEIWAQHTVNGSVLRSLGQGHDRGAARDGAPALAAQLLVIERDGDEWRRLENVPLLYMVAVASDTELPPLPRDSTLADPGLALTRAAERSMADRLNAVIDELNAQIVEANDRTGAEVERLNAHIVESNARAMAEIDDARQRHAIQLRAARQEITKLQTRAVGDAHMIASLQASVSDLRHRMGVIEGSVTWALFQKARRKAFALLGGEGSASVRVLQAALRFTGRGLRLFGDRATDTAVAGVAPGARDLVPTADPLEIPCSESPVASIVMPLYAHPELTRAALESIRDNTSAPAYEVILVDDQADPGTKLLLEQVRGARVVVNNENVGYLHSVQRGVAAAKGDWLVLCNNDIEVQPGWLEALLSCARSGPDVAIVAPKYLSPDGLVSEAGGIVWGDGAGCNYGRGNEPGSWRYEYRREIDYGSAAALLVRRDFWRDVGGFDERFLPMYYEDTDLCFEAQARDLRVMYEPEAIVVHVEGATAGVDEDGGYKLYQALNRPKFVDKWRDRLETEQLPNSGDHSNDWLGANMPTRPRVLFVDHRVPMSDRESGALRTRGMIEALLAHGCHVTFLPDNLHPAQPYTRELQRLGVEVMYGFNDEGLETILGATSLVILSRPEVADRWLATVQEHAPDALVAYDTVDLHWLREARREAVQTGSDELVLTREVRKTRELEYGLIQESDLTIVVSDEERIQVESDVPGAVVRVIPNVNPVRSVVPGVEGRSGVMFVGGFEHVPNVDAALMLVRDVMPLVWQSLPEVKVTIVGPDAPTEITELASPQVEVTGWVPHMEPILDTSRAMVAPLTYGAGLKGKVTQALANGLPVVTTPVGAEGLDAQDGGELLIGTDAEELASRVVQVLSEDVLWKQLSHAGRILAEERCSPRIVSDRLGELLELAQPRGSVGAG